MLLKLGEVLHGMQKRKEEERGFTLIELLVVVIIIGILAAIAIPVFLGQRERAQEGTVQSDVRNAQSQVAIEVADENTVPTGSYTTAAPLTGTNGDFTPSADVTITIAGDPADYTITGTHADLAGYSFEYDAATGAYTETP